MLSGIIISSFGGEQHSTFHLRKKIRRVLQTQNPLVANPYNDLFYFFLGIKEEEAKGKRKPNDESMF